MRCFQHVSNGYDRTECRNIDHVVQIPIISANPINTFPYAEAVRPSARFTFDMKMMLLPSSSPSSRDDLNYARLDRPLAHGEKVEATTQEARELLHHTSTRPSRRTLGYD